MPKWIHDRARHIQEKNPDMPKSQSFAIATQQSYAAGKAPKKYGTPMGRHEAYQKYDDPKSTYEPKADPEKSKTSAVGEFVWSGFFDELEKISESPVASSLSKARQLPKIPQKGPVQVHTGGPPSGGSTTASAKAQIPGPITTGHEAKT